MSSVIYDIGYIQAGIESLEAFLLSENLFWSLDVPSPIGPVSYPRLTLGGLLLTLARLRARTLLPTQSTQVQVLESKINYYRSRWGNAWTRKGQREFSSRLRQWDNYLKDLRLNPDDHIVYFRSEVRTRVILDLIKPEIKTLTTEYLELLNNMDVFLRSILEDNGFIWEPDLIQGFDSKQYWYLWGQPKVEKIELF